MSPKVLNKPRGINQWTPLHVASWFGNDKAVQVLVELGANVLAQDKDGRTALHLAVQKRRRRVVRVLMTAGKAELANIKDNTGLTVLDNAAKTDKSLVAVIDRFVNKSYKSTTKERTLRAGRKDDTGRRETRQKNTRITKKALMGGRGRGGIAIAEESDNNWTMNI